MAGLVPAIIPSPQSLFPAPPTVHSDDVLAWNATCGPPVASAAMLGLVPGIMPSFQSVVPASPVVKRAPVFAWNAASVADDAAAPGCHCPKSFASASSLSQQLESPAAVTPF